MERLAQDVQEHPDAYYYERAARLGASQSGIYAAMQRLGVTYKKNTVASEGGRQRQANLPGPDRNS